MALKDLTEYLQDDVLEVKVSGKAHPDGKTYRIAEPDAHTGLYLMALAQTATRAASGAEVTADELASLQFEGGREVDLTRMVLGDVYDELCTDQVPLRKIAGVTQYAFVHFTMGETVAEQLLPSGEAQAPNRNARRKASRGGATSTTQRGSTAGTTSPRKPKRKPKAT
ncbi:DUF7426 family protein [Amycolatopsis eburnea]|uniref:DUF7426 family protein n=1 Tax=Amycolatopsis eburnea TaxID=2267691 RepID=UPI0013153BD5|nr:hypothetical protein [Amycolatopsis eburnea]